jgi:hypothetical protein
MLLRAVNKYTILNLPTIACKSDDFLHSHNVPTNMSSRSHNGLFLIVRPYKVVTVRSDFHNNLSALKDFYFPQTNVSEVNLLQTRSMVCTDAG